LTVNFQLKGKSFSLSVFLAKICWQLQDFKKREEICEGNPLFHRIITSDPQPNLKVLTTIVKIQILYRLQAQATSQALRN
jgi:hypothetical protein